MEAVKSLVDVGNDSGDVVTVIGAFGKDSPFRVGGVAMDGSAVNRGGGRDIFDDIPEGFLNEYDIRVVFFLFLRWCQLGFCFF